LSFGGFEITGLDLQKLKSGKLSVDLPMTPGDYEVPGVFETAKLKIKNDCTVRVDLEISQNDEGIPAIKLAKVTFSKDFIVKNPSAAMQPTETPYAWLNWILDIIKDFLADFHVRSVTLDDDNFLRVNGVAGPLHLIKKHKEAATVNRLLKLPLDPQNPPIKKYPPPPETPRASHLKPEAPAPTIDEVPALLKELGAMTGVASFQLEGASDPVTLGIKGHDMELQGQEGPVAVKISGEAEVTPEGKISLRILQSADPLLTTAFATAEGVGYMDLEYDKDKGMLGDGELAIKTQIREVRGKFHPHDSLDVPLNLTGADIIEATGKTGVTLRNKDLTLSDGTFRVETRDDVDDDTKIVAGATTFELDDGRVELTAEGKFEADKEDASVWDTTFSVNIDGEDAFISYDNFRARVEGMLKARLKAEGINLDLFDRSADFGGGSFTYELDPRSEALRDRAALGLFRQNIDFSLKPDGKLQIRPGQQNFAEFAAPFLKVIGNPDQLIDPKSPAVGAVGSPEMMAHIESLTGATLRDGNTVELLVDGVQSYPRRLELIRNAKESLCLQTLIFKDDETGLETANELIAAANRGVKVRVIIDTLGNASDIDHVTDGKELYKMLRAGGVELELYNDPRTSGLGELVEAARHIPALQQVEGPQSLQDPKILLAFFQQVLQVAAGESDAPASVQEAVSRALKKFTNAAGVFTKDEVIEISTGALFESTHTMLVLKLVAEMNHRWHEKYLIADGNEAVMGGMNISDEYLLGGTGRNTMNLGIEREAWRDTDMWFGGPAARAAYEGFGKNWEHLRGEKLPQPSTPIDQLAEGRAKMQLVQHRPRVDKDHHITNVMVENLKALKPGQKAYVNNSYFIPVGALENYKQALIDAAQRGVDVRVVTNSATTTDFAEINYAATFAYREMLEGGVRIFERSGERTMHSKVCVFGDDTAIVGSWNTDNRSASLNSESVVVVYDKPFTRELTDMIQNDMAPGTADEILLENISALPWDEEIRNSALAVLSPLM
jgi:phosphatidylserine/phosphatidylglycerophosphate/cardiolipin synthase-like enzyme